MPSIDQFRIASLVLTPLAAILLGSPSPVAAQGTPSQEAMALFVEGMAALYNEDHASAVEPMTRAADLGYAPARVTLGEMHSNGWGFEPNMNEAARWWRAAADQGNPTAQTYMGHLYRGLIPNVVPMDYAEALRWFGLAADQGMAPAMLSIASMYEQGQGVPADREAAREWYLRAGDSGDFMTVSQVVEALERLTPAAPPPPPVVATPSDARREMNALNARALQQHEAGQVEEAGRTFSSVLEANPFHRDALRLGAVIAVRQQQLREAVALNRRALALEPNHGGLWVGQAFTFEGIARNATDAAARGAASDSAAAYLQILQKQNPLPEVHIDRWENPVEGGEGSMLDGRIENRTTTPQTYGLEVELLDRTGTVVAIARIAPQSIPAGTISAPFRVTTEDPRVVAFRYRVTR